ncbi:MAG: hypothetical protein P8J37_13490 [Fuerstiella sp.]|nr:hypothetical protein [Fuerstiella sp.]
MRLKTSSCCAAVALLVSLVSVADAAQLRLPAVFSDDMVLRRG